MTSKMAGNFEHLDPLVPITPEQAIELAQLKADFNHIIHKIMNLHHFDLTQVYPETEDLGELYQQLSDLKKCLDSFRPFNPAQVENLREAWDTQYTYESNRIEGNTLSLRETSFVINEGLTVRDKSLREHLEAINHQEAINYIREIISGNSVFDERMLKNIHALILHGIDRANAGIYRSVSVGIRGTNIIFPQPYLLQNLMEDFFRFYDQEKDNLHPVELAAQLHARLVNIHPFIDGNGRTSRLVMNLFLLKTGYPMTVISGDEDSRNAYFEALNKARDGSDPDAFNIFIAKQVKAWCFEYLKMVSGNTGDHDQDKGYYYFKKIEPYLKSKKL